MFESALAELLGVKPGVTAVIGSGGKTTLLKLLAAGMPGTVLLCTSTHIYPFPNLPIMESPSRSGLKDAFRKHRVICAGTPEPETGKLTSLPYPLDGLADYVLVEADGAAGMPLKGHRPGEPVVPPEARRVIQVVGMTGMGRKIGEVVHHPDAFMQRVRRKLDDYVTPTSLAEVLTMEDLADVVLFNQADHMHAVAGLTSKLIPQLALVASLRDRWVECAP